MIVFLSIIALLVLVVFLYMQQPKFGKAPNGERLERIKQSPQYHDGSFKNTSFTPTLTKGYSMLGLLYEQFFKLHPNKTPNGNIPNTKTNLHELSPDETVLVWFGHSSYFIQIEGLKFLIDPVFSGNASPIPGSVKAFKGADTYTVNDLPKIDYLLITHDHYDHLDYPTITQLKNKVAHVICGLGVGSHLEYWGYKPENITENDWHDTVKIKNNIKLHTTPARHFSGRTFKRNNTLWLSYVLETPNLKLFLGGDSGYDTHFKAIGDKHGPFDLAILENGQYNLAWEAIHTLPEQVLKAATDLKTKRLFPVHSAKFALAMHPWDEPLNEVYRLNKLYNFPLVTPIIGEKLNLNDTTQQFKAWWKAVD